MDGSEVLVLLEGQELSRGVEDIRVEWAGKEFGGCVEGCANGGHEGVGNSPVIAEV